MRDREELLQRTKELKQYLLKIDDIFETVKKNGEKKEFYTVVKPFVDEVHQFIDTWMKLALEWQKKTHPKNIFPQQIENAGENLKEISIQAFYPETSYKRFKHHVHSIQYTIEKILTELEKLTY